MIGRLISKVLALLFPEQPSAIPHAERLCLGGSIHPTKRLH